MKTITSEQAIAIAKATNPKIDWQIVDPATLSKSAQWEGIDLTDDPSDHEARFIFQIPLNDKGTLGYWVDLHEEKVSDESYTLYRQL